MRRATEESDYSEALDWYGLEFREEGDWSLVIRKDAADAQRAHVAALLSSAPG